MNAPLLELDAVSSLLREQPGVAEVAAFRSSSREPPLRVVAVVREPFGGLADIRDQLWDALPTAELPDVLVMVPALPRNENGEVDTGRIERDALDQPGSCTFRAPGTPTEVALAAVWSEVLGRARIGADDNLLDLGGDSMTAALLLDLTNERLGVDLSLDTLLGAASLAALARHVDESHER
jgi:hypothetical protein